MAKLVSARGCANKSEGRGARVALLQTLERGANIGTCLESPVASHRLSKHSLIKKAAATVTAAIAAAAFPTATITAAMCIAVLGGGA